MGNNSATANTTVTDQADLTGTIYEDINGDGSLADGVTRSGVDVFLYRDGDGQPDGIDDTLVGSDTTDGAGVYGFLDITPASYWVVVDAKTVSPSAAFNGGSDLQDVWVEQTYGPRGASCSNGSRYSGVSRPGAFRRSPWRSADQASSWEAPSISPRSTYPAGRAMSTSPSASTW